MTGYSYVGDIWTGRTTTGGSTCDTGVGSATAGPTPTTSTIIFTKGTTMKTILAVIMLTIATLSGCSSTEEAPASTTGVYSDDKFRASVEEDVIVIEILSGDTKMLYWQGSWQDGENTVVSTGDRDALDGSLMGSGADTKEFEVDGDTLKFEFQALGSKTNVSLDKE